MPRRQLTKKPLPQGPVAWAKEVGGVADYLSRLDDYTADNGTEWVARQKAYYRKRLKDLLNFPPPAIRKDGPHVTVTVSGDPNAVLG